MWLLLPILLIGAVALYFGRVEEVSKSQAPGIFVSDFQVEPAPGFYQAKGLSHRVTVTLDYGGPKPKWWGVGPNNIIGIDALHPENKMRIPGGQTPTQLLMIGEAITVKRAGKTKRLPGKYGGNTVDFRFDGAHYISVNYLGLGAIPKEWGAVTLHGLYRIKGQPQLLLKRQVRAAGQSLALAPNKNPGARVAKVTTSPFRSVMARSLTGANVRQDETRVEVQIIRTRPSALPANEQRVTCEVEMTDEKGVVYQPYSTPGFMMSWSSTMNQGSSGVSPVIQGQSLGLGLEPSLHTTGRLKLHGKVSVDEGWPLPFEVDLPPRPKQKGGR